MVLTIDFGWLLSIETYIFIGLYFGVGVALSVPFASILYTNPAHIKNHSPISTVAWIILFYPALIYWAVEEIINADFNKQ